eukprot:s8126_g2.t1
MNFEAISPRLVYEGPEGEREVLLRPADHLSTAWDSGALGATAATVGPAMALQTVVPPPTETRGLFGTMRSTQP